MSQVIENGQIQRPTTYQDYSIERKAEVLALVQSNGGNIKRTANETGIHHATIQYWLDNASRFAEIQPKKSIELAQKFENAAHKYLDIAYGKAENAEFNHLMTGAGIAVDKMQLLRGQPTSITETVDRASMISVIQGVLSEALGQSEKVIDVQADNGLTR